MIYTRLHEVVKYGTDVHYTPGTACIVMNLDVWQKLPDNVQKIFLDTGREATFLLVDKIEQDRAKTVEKIRKSGVEFYDFSDSDLKKWTTLPEIKRMKDDWITDKEKQGLSGKRVMNKFVELTEK